MRSRQLNMDAYGTDNIGRAMWMSMTRFSSHGCEEISS